MPSNTLFIKKSPFLFIKYLILITFLFALLPFLIAWIMDARESYEALALAKSLSYNLFVTIAVTVIQLVIIFISFLAWYVPTYRIDEDEVIYERGNLFGDRKLAATQSIGDIVVRQGFMAKRFNYGTLVLRSYDGEKLAQIGNIPSPAIHADQVEALTGSDGDDAPLADMTIEELIARGESQHVEYKSSLIWDYRQQKPNKVLYEPVMKNLVAFMNSTGGVLLIGVADDGEILGLEPDFGTLKRQNVDGFELAFNMAFNKMIGVEYRRFVDVTFPEIEDKVICKVDVRPSSRPAYLINKGREHFYIRAGNGSQPLTMSQANNYIRDRF